MKIAIAQDQPALLQRDETLAIVLRCIEEARNHNASLIAFGETFVPGYPLWLEHTDAARFDSPLQKEIHARYVQEAVVVERGDLDAVMRKAKECKIAVVLGIAERDPNRGQSVFATAISIDAQGRLQAQHRKLIPTYEERLAWSHGDAHGLRTWELGDFRVGVLNCWENWMPLARTALYAQGETLHVAIWPGSCRTTELITRFVARESRSYVVSASAIYRGTELPDDFPRRDEVVAMLPELVHDGGSCVASPDGEFLVAPVIGRQELIFAELDPAKVAGERQNFDATGHYSRPELLRLSVDQRRYTAFESS